MRQKKSPPDVVADTLKFVGNNLRTTVPLALNGLTGKKAPAKPKTPKPAPKKKK